MKCGRRIEMSAAEMHAEFPGDQTKLKSNISRLRDLVKYIVETCHHLVDIGPAEHPSWECITDGK